MTYWPQWRHSTSFCLLLERLQSQQHLRLKTRSRLGVSRLSTFAYGWIIDIKRSETLLTSNPQCVDHHRSAPFTVLVQQHQNLHRGKQNSKKAARLQSTIKKTCLWLVAVCVCEHGLCRWCFCCREATVKAAAALPGVWGRSLGSFDWCGRWSEAFLAAAAEHPQCSTQLSGSDTLEPLEKK